MKNFKIGIPIFICNKKFQIQIIFFIIEMKNFQNWNIDFQIHITSSTLIENPPFATTFSITSWL